MPYHRNSKERRCNMGGDKVLQFEEQNFDWLVEKFLRQWRSHWDTFVWEEWEKAQQEPPEPDR